MVERKLGFTFGRTPEGQENDYNALLKRIEQQSAPVVPEVSEIPNVTPDDNPAQVTPTNGWLYVPSIGMEFSPTLEGLGSNFYDAHKLARGKGFVMPSPAETWALIFEAKANLSKPEFRKIYEFFTEKTPQNTWHGEWQDAYFKEEKGKMYMHGSGRFNNKGELEFLTGVDITGTYLAKDGYANISQRTNITPQGLCKTKDSRDDYVKGENMYFWYPRNNSVARFDAFSDWAGFYCIGVPSGSGSSLGVRFARRVAPSVVGKNGGKK
jgi:hypothetical protein